MAILGVLLGITSTLLAGLIWFAVWFVRREHRYLRELNHACTLDHQRIAAIEEAKSEDVDTLGRKFAEVDGRFTAIETAMASTEKSIKSIAEPKSYRPRTWNEDTAQAEAK